MVWRKLVFYICHMARARLLVLIVDSNGRLRHPRSGLRRMTKSKTRQQPHPTAAVTDGRKREDNRNIVLTHSAHSTRVISLALRCVHLITPEWSCLVALDDASGRSAPGSISIWGLEWCTSEGRMFGHVWWMVADRRSKFSGRGIPRWLCRAPHFVAAEMKLSILKNPGQYLDILFCVFSRSFTVRQQAD